MPCKALVDAGTDATLLIHEATIEDDTPSHLKELEEFNKTALPAARKLTYAELAASKGHTTFAQAVEVGRS
jgi:ribonuclease BN (tRNA processing enzyme)